MTDIQQMLADRPATVGELFTWRVRTTPDAIAYRYPDPATPGVVHDLTWREAETIVHELAGGLLSLGLELEERVAIASSTRYEWVLMDLAINLAGGATTSVYPNTEGPEFTHIVTHSDSHYFVGENAKQVTKLRERVEPGQVKRVIVFDPEGVEGDDVLTLEQLRAAGRAHLAEHPDAVTDAIAATGADTLATLIYTSGTTGMPKGVELVHGNWTYQAEAINSLGFISDQDAQYFWLPLSHVFGKDILTIGIRCGFSSTIDGRLDMIMDGLGESSPTVMVGAPRIFEKVRNAVRASAPGSVKGRISRWAFAVGRNSRPWRLAGQPMPARLRTQYALADKLVFSKLKQKLGGNLRFFVSGSAKLSPQVQEWFYSAGLTIIEGYGATETSAVAFVDDPPTPRLGTVGRCLPGSEVRIADDGEILYRGPGVMRGYHNDPERTAEVLVDGWFHTGDVGELDEEGYLRITDRKKDLMKTSGGKYVAPQRVEGAISANVPYVSQAVAVGDGRKYIAALVTLDPGAVASWAKRHGQEDKEYAELTQSPELRASVDRFMERANAQLERWETVKRYAILDHEFTTEDGGLTASLKVRRANIAQQYADVVDSLYDKDDEA